MKLQPVSIERNWERIKYMVANIVDGTHVKPEDIYAACKYNQAHLYVSADGFMVLREDTHKFDRAKILFIWVAARFDNKTGLVEQYKDEVLEIAKSIGAERIEFSTTRLGFSKIAPEGYRVSSITYELEI